MSTVLSVKNIRSQMVFMPCAAPPREAFSKSFYARKRRFFCSPATLSLYSIPFPGHLGWFMEKVVRYV